MDKTKIYVYEDDAGRNWWFRYSEKRSKLLGTMFNEVSQIPGFEFLEPDGTTIDGGRLPKYPYPRSFMRRVTIKLDAGGWLQCVCTTNKNAAYLHGGYLIGYKGSEQISGWVTGAQGERRQFGKREEFHGQP